MEIVWRREQPSQQRCAAVTTLATIVAEKLPVIIACAAASP